MTEGIRSEINVTPLCDIFVVLLLILMVAADARNQQGPAADMPRGGASTPPPEACEITLPQDLGSVYLNGEKVTALGGRGVR